MSGFGKKVVGQWNDWQLIVLVLLSLLVQLLLLGTAGSRRRTRPRWWMKKYFWALYIGSRYLATYPLGILSRASTNDSNADLQAFWAALLLFHLGGPDDFTALSLEDNKIWDRQCFDLFLQAVTTAYVFSRYVPDEHFKPLIAPFVLISLAGMMKCVEKVLALKEARMEALIKSVLGTPDAGPDYADTMDRVDGMLRSGVLPSINFNNKLLGQPNSDAMEAGETRTDEQLPVNIIRSAHSLFSRFKVLFADGIFSFEDRRESQALFSNKNAKWAFKVIEIELSFVYDWLYTKASVSRRISGIVIRITTLLLTLAASLYTFFVTIHAVKYRMRHRCVTYTLLAGAVLTEAAILARHIYSIWSLVDSDSLKCCSASLVSRCRWSGYMAQSNLISFCLQKLPADSELKAFLVAFSRPRQRGRTALAPLLLPSSFALLPSSFAALLLPGSFAASLTAIEAAGDAIGAGVWEYLQTPSVLDQLQSKSFWKKYEKTRSIPVQEYLKDFIFEQVKKKPNQIEKIRAREEENQTTGTPGRRKPFTDRWDDWLLLDREVGSLGLCWSYDGREFDESLLLWHIATDLCFRQDVNQGTDMTDKQVGKHREIGTEISNYLLYIMMVHPLMLSSSTTMAAKRCRDTCAEARRHFLKEHIGIKCTNGEAVNEENAHDYLLRVETPLQAFVVKGDKSKSVLWDGCALAKQLDRILDKDKKWQVVCRVWVEMLCYAAVQCGGYQHAARLSEGGELITFVCLLMTHFGMGKHYRTEVGDAHAHLSPFTPQIASKPALATAKLASKPAPAQAQRTKKEVSHAAFSIDDASSSGTAGHP